MLDNHKAGASSSRAVSRTLIPSLETKRHIHLAPSQPPQLLGEDHAEKTKKKGGKGLLYNRMGTQNRRSFRCSYYNHSSYTGAVVPKLAGDEFISACRGASWQNAPDKLSLSSRWPPLETDPWFLQVVRLDVQLPDHAVSTWAVMGHQQVVSSFVKDHLNATPPMATIQLSLRLRAF